ncbi:MAG: hypothetical protein A3F48_00315 [Candidatus Yanofskybacteria bacterium RIFCSPHIGHO2_12_FULL_41_9]|nr:MAG: hypothetical protein A3F48_00315 [Candidatus Yanofskybacteria bacterium RIFCSPHIGHO2_12_FULL_41_9]
MPGGGGTQNLTRRVGLLKSLGMILDPKMEVEASKPWVDEVLDDITPEHLDNFINKGLWKRNRPSLWPELNKDLAEASELISKLRRGFAGQSPIAFEAAVVAILVGNHKNLELGLALEAELVIKLFENSADNIKEGIRSKFERRDPIFS